MPSQEFHILLKNEDYQQMKKQINDLNTNICRLEKKINAIENKNILYDILFYLNDWIECFMLFILDKIIEVPAE